VLRFGIPMLVATPGLTWIATLVTLGACVYLDRHLQTSVRHAGTVLFPDVHVATPVFGLGPQRHSQYST